MKNNSVRQLAVGAIVAALYVVLTYLSSFFGLASGVIQLRLAEALSVLPLFFPGAVMGLPVGCLLANALTGCMPLDVVFGTLATGLGAVGCRLIAQSKLSTRAKILLAPLPNIFMNTLIVPFILVWVYQVSDALPFLFLTVGIGEILSSGVLGYAFITHFDQKFLSKMMK